MLAQIPFPEVSPEIFTLPIGGMEFALRWYALAYIVGIIIAWRVSIRAVSREDLWEGAPPVTKQQLEDLLTWIIIGIILGGRIGFVLFYEPAYYLTNPSQILKVWQGGMAFHGGFLGVVVASWMWCARNGVSKIAAADTIALGVPWGLMLGRLANFINAELWGRPSDVPWAMKFPTMCQNTMLQGCEKAGEWFYTGGELTRHPSQLYQAALEGALLGLVLLYLAFARSALKIPGLVTGIFIAGYGTARFIVEQFRQADAQFITSENPFGHVFLGLTMGQLLSLPMVLIGVAIIFWARRQRAP
ncbi:prolipoprotein diacylglyceryl transferase [Lentibacter sp. XHP0401]|uniref:prolipoprotein diacylglyceryl transferase n=1 Tax=Lentibacter sp. XHP0401 TaxID=2984334 RepID=UPI0021E8D8C8|nr:prolipoprotein diacylglyceryl transferase [Lentibacter sp. XHP0401]MCV2894222.1 prolipoprotein diacylglyceryl transferase [Lentibacter sp. XHP0401]